MYRTKAEEKPNPLISFDKMKNEIEWAQTARGQQTASFFNRNELKEKIEM